MFNILVNLSAGSEVPSNFLSGRKTKLGVKDDFLDSQGTIQWLEDMFSIWLTPLNSLTWIWNCLDVYWMSRSVQRNWKIWENLKSYTFSVICSTLSFGWRLWEPVLCLRILIAVAIYCVSYEPRILYKFVFHSLCYTVSWAQWFYFMYKETEAKWDQAAWQHKVRCTLNHCTLMTIWKRT